MEQLSIAAEDAVEEGIEGNEPTEASAQADELDLIEPNKEVVHWHFGERHYTQKPLSFFGKMEFMSLLGTATDLAIQDGLSMDQLMSGAEELRSFTGGSGLGNADSLMRILARLMVYSPNLLADAFCIFLAVPRGERDAVKALMAESPEKGGLTDAQAILIIQTFIDQNMDTLVELFTGELPKLLARGRKLAKQARATQSPRSKR